MHVLKSWCLRLQQATLRQVISAAVVAIVAAIVAATIAVKMAPYIHLETKHGFVQDSRNREIVR